MPVASCLQIPDHGINMIGDRILLFRHEYNSSNILQVINSASEITDATLLEIVLTGNSELMPFIRASRFICLPFSEHNTRNYRCETSRAFRAFIQNTNIL